MITRFCLYYSDIFRRYFSHTFSPLMKLLFFVLATLFSSLPLFAQGGWRHVDDDDNDISAYSTIRNYTGAAFADINNDGLTDIFAAPFSVFLNNGNGKFTKSTPVPFSPQSGTSGCSWADIDNDGDNDLVIACTPSRVFLNDGIGNFISVTNVFEGLSSYGSFGCAIGDMDGNSNLEIIFAHANGFHPSQPTPCKLFIGSQTGFSYTLSTGYPFTDMLGPYTNPYWSDFDMDGDMDLFIATGPAGSAGLDFCYKNMKKETGKDSLQRMTTELFAAQTQDGQCYGFVDVDNDGDLDLCLTNYFGVGSRLYINDKGTYSLKTTPFTTAATNLANCWGDYDNDGDLDVIITNDNAPVKYYRNDGGANFTYLPNGLSTPTATCSAVNADYDNDGDLDVFINGIGNNGATVSVGLYRNDTVAGQRSWVNFALAATKTNHSALGTIVKTRATIQGQPVWQMREITAQSSFQGQNDIRVHFGLNDALTVDSLIIIWASGVTERYGNIPAKRFYRITEGVDFTTAVDEQPAGADIGIYPNPAGSAVTVGLPQLPAEGTMYVITDATGRKVLTGMIESQQQQINVSALSAGLYAIRITTLHGSTGARTFIR